MADQITRQKPRRTFKAVAGSGVVALGFGLLVVVGVPLSSGLFPSEVQASCAVTERPYGVRKRLGGPRVYTSCGTFLSTKVTTCTADPGLETALIPGFTYDLTVRGAELPFTVSREVVSAEVTPAEEAPGKTPAGDGGFSPEALRAFDYEQPPYTAECEVSRMVMTSIGAQLMTPERAAEVLTLPIGMTPRTPLLPCEGYRCAPTI